MVQRIREEPSTSATYSLPTRIAILNGMGAAMVAPQPQLHVRERARVLQVEGPKSRSASVIVPCARGDVDNDALHGGLVYFKLADARPSRDHHIKFAAASGTWLDKRDIAVSFHEAIHTVMGFSCSARATLALGAAIAIAFLRVDPDAIQDLVDHVQEHPTVARDLGFCLLAISHPTRVVRIAICSETWQSNRRSNLRVHISDNAKAQVVLAMVERNFAVSLQDSRGESTWPLTNLAECAVQPAHRMNPASRPLASSLPVDDVASDGCSGLQLLMVMKQHQWVWTRFPALVKRGDMQPVKPTPTRDEAKGGPE